MNPEQWLSLKWNGGSTMSDRWLNQSKIIQNSEDSFLNLFLILIGMKVYTKFLMINHPFSKSDLLYT